MDWNQISQLGTVGIIFAFAIREFFGYLKTKNGNGGSHSNGDKYVTVREFSQLGRDFAVSQETLKEIKTNHLKHIEDWMKKHDEEHVEDRTLLLQIAIKMGIDISKK